MNCLISPTITIRTPPPTPPEGRKPAGSVLPTAGRGCKRARAHVKNEELELLQRRWKQSIGPRDPAHNRPGGFPREKHFPSGNACANHYDLGRLYFEGV